MGLWDKKEAPEAVEQEAPAEEMQEEEAQVEEADQAPTMTEMQAQVDRSNQQARQFQATADRAMSEVDKLKVEMMTQNQQTKQQQTQSVVNQQLDKLRDSGQDDVADVIESIAKQYAQPQQTAQQPQNVRQTVSADEWLQRQDRIEEITKMANAGDFDQSRVGQTDTVGSYHALNSQLLAKENAALKKAAAERNKVPATGSPDRGTVPKTAQGGSAAMQALVSIGAKQGLKQG